MSERRPALYRNTLSYFGGLAIVGSVLMILLFVIMELTADHASPYLGLITYLTAGPQETRAWTIREGTKAPQAAAVIHTDFERGFIKAEVMRWEDLVGLGSEVNVKQQGKLRMEGKEYVVKDGDVMHFRFNV